MILFVLLFGLGLFYLITNGYIHMNQFNIEDINSNTLILIAMGIIIIFLLFSNRRSGASRGARGQGGGGAGRKGGRGRGR